MLPSSELAAPMQRAAFSGYAQISDHIGALSQAYLRVLSVLSLIVLPAGAGLCLIASPLVHLALGDKWLEAIPVIRILAVEGVLVVALSSAYYVYLALAIPQRLTAVMALHAGIALVLMLMLIPAHGLVGAAIAWIAATIASVPVNFAILSRCLQMRLRSIGAATARPAVATIVMAMLVLLLQWTWVPDAGPLATISQLTVSIMVGVFSYAGAIFALWHFAGRPEGAERYALERVRLFFPLRSLKGS
jgi:O-antigen/teichoic acid export membrane protein